MDERDLVDRCKQGDRTAYDELVRRHQDRLFSLIYRCVGDYEEAGDVAQEVLIRAYRAISGFQGQSAFYTWLHRIAVNEVISHRRRGSAVRKVKTVPISRNDPESESGGSEDPPDTSSEPSRLMDRKEREGLIQDAIQSLETEQRVIVVLRDVEGYDYDAIARMVGCPRGTVKSRLHRARLELRNKLRPLLETSGEEAAAQENRNEV